MELLDVRNKIAHDEVFADDDAYRAIDTALARGDPSHALALFAEHAQRFPNARHAGEREGLWTKVCAAQGDGGSHTAKRFCAGRR